jgi:hypothetical protein
MGRMTRIIFFLDMLKISKNIFSQRLKKIAKEKMKYLLKYLVIFYLSNWNFKIK